MLCRSCGLINLLAEKRDADVQAIEELKRQARNEPPLLAQITLAQVEQLEAQVAVEKALKKGLTQARKTLRNQIKRDLDMGIPADNWLLMSRNELINYILEGGMGEVVDGFLDATNTVYDLTLKQLSLEGLELDPATLALDRERLNAQLVGAVFDDVILPDISQRIRSTLSAIDADVSIPKTVDLLFQRFQAAEGRALTEARTATAQWGRSLTAQAAEEAGLDHYLYVGPRDGITRSFCEKLIDLVVSEKQMRKLNNNQGLSVKVSAGGYNCRHSWAPVSEAFIEVADLERATDADISAANKAAKE
jgi:hypothetical protein